MKDTAVQSHPLLFEEERTGRFQLEGDRHYGNDGNGENQPQDTAKNIHHTLENHVPGFVHGGRDGHQRDAAQFLDTALQTRRKHVRLVPLQDRSREGIFR